MLIALFASLFNTAWCINFTYIPKCLDLNCNATGKEFISTDCELYVTSYLQTYTGAGLYLSETPYNNNIVPIATEGILVNF